MYVAVGVVAIGGWTLATIAPFFWLLRRINRLRCSEAVELDGLDRSKHGGAAYNWHSDPGACSPLASGKASDRGVSAVAAASTAHVVADDHNPKANAVVPFDDC